MQFGDSTITTPFDNPVQYDPDWRNSFALASIDFPNEAIPSEYSEYKNDKWIKKQVSYLKAVKSGRKLTPTQHNLRLASLWFQGSKVSDVKSRIEPLLLTPVQFDIVALDIGGGAVAAEAFQAYERLYFNIRLDDGKQNSSCHLRQYFALPAGDMGPKTPHVELWKIVGALMGYDTLVSMWLWTGAHGIVNKSRDYMLDEMWRVAQANLFMDIFTHRVSNEALSKLLGSFTNQTRMVRETGGTGVPVLDSTKALLSFLQLTAPEMLTSARIVDDQKKIIDENIKARLAAQKNVSMQDVVDRGVASGEDALNQRMKAQFSSFAPAGNTASPTKAPAKQTIPPTTTKSKATR